MFVYITFKCLHVDIVLEKGNREESRKDYSLRKETIRVESLLASGGFNSEGVRISLAFTRWRTFAR